VYIVSISTKFCLLFFNVFVIIWKFISITADSMDNGWHETRKRGPKISGSNPIKATLRAGDEGRSD
jgi:hypothetical protein